MYALVVDVGSYLGFVPWCAAADVLEQSATLQLASVSIASQWQNTTFSTRNTLTADAGVDMCLIDGPFKRLAGHWRFIPLSPEACKVELRVELDLGGLGGILGSVIERTASRVVAAFVAEAGRRYSRES